MNQTKTWPLARNEIPSTLDSLRSTLAAVAMKNGVKAELQKTPQGVSWLRLVAQVIEHQALHHNVLGSNRKVSSSISSAVFELLSLLWEKHFRKAMHRLWQKCTAQQY